MSGDTPDAARPAVGALVLGMGRSGTSAVTRILVVSGFFAAETPDLMEPNPANPKGFWENLLVHRLNEEILECLGGTWFVPPTSEAKLAARSWAVPRVEALFQRLRTQARGAPIVLKDPRIGVLLELWCPVIDGALHPVLAVRNPVEVAASLEARDGTPPAFALASWQLHMTGVLRYLHGRTVTVAPYADLVLSPPAGRQLVRDVAARIAPEHAGHIDADAAAAATDPGLYRQHADVGEIGDRLTGRQADLWQFLSRLELGDQVLDVPEELTRPSAAAHSLAEYETARMGDQLRVTELHAQLQSRESENSELRRSVADAERARESTEAALAEMRARAEQAEQRLEVVIGSRSWRGTAPLRNAVRLARRVRP